MKYLSEKGYRTIANNLPGHGTTIQECNRIKYRDWLQAVEQDVAKFLATVLIGEVLLNAIFNMNINFGFNESIFQTINMHSVMIVYGIGVCSIWGVLSLLYKHAYNHRKLLKLNNNEIRITKETILVYSIMSLFGLSSIILACILPSNLISISGWIYCAIGPTIAVA